MTIFNRIVEDIDGGARDRPAAGRGKGRASREGVEVQQSRPHALELCQRALEVCRRLGFSPISQELFAQAYLSDCCCLCHGPMSNFLHDLPCPHWLLRKSRQHEELAGIFEVYALTDVLQFLLLAMQMSNRAHRPPMLAVLRASGQDGVKLRIDKREFSFSMDGAEQAAPVVSITVEYSRPRFAVTLSVTGRESDREMLSALVAAVEGGATLPDRHSLMAEPCKESGQ